MTPNLIDKIATALLYEGYLLYPYRASAVKNRQRFNFGVVVPREYSISQSDTEAWTMQTECLIHGDRPTIHVRPRFLHLQHRQVNEINQSSENSGPMIASACGGGAPRYEEAPVCSGDSDDAAPWPPSRQFFHFEELKRPAGNAQPVEFLEVSGQRYQTWQEALEREVDSLEWSLAELAETPRQIPFEFGPDESIEDIRADGNEQVGFIARTQQKIHGMLSLQASRLADDLYRLQATVQNTTPLPVAAELAREQALLYSFVSTHIVLNVSDGDFVSLLEPPNEFVDAAAGCQQRGCWPVLVGESEDRSTMLASPIILYDYPEIAPESPGDFFDGTEMDEMLMLRVMTMTDEEHHEMENVDHQARRLLQRARTLPQDDLMKLHGTVRGLRPIEPIRITFEENGANAQP